MGSEWRESTLGEFCPFTYGKGLPEKKRKGTGTIQVFGSNGVVGTHDLAYVDDAGIIIGRKGTVGAVHYSDSPFWPIDTTFYIENEPEKRDLRFTYYLLQSIGLDIMNSDSAVPGLNRDAAHRRAVKVPDISEQKIIANILGTLDDKIELNRKMNETLEAMAQALFKSWFVDFDPVIDKALAAGNPIPKELSEKAGRRKQLGDKRKPIPEDIASLFPDEFEKSELGWIPKGWEVKPLSDVFELNPKCNLKKGDIAPYVEMKNLPQHSARVLVWYNRKFTSGMKFINGDTLVARITPCLENGKGAFVDFLTEDEVGWGSTEYIVFRSKGSMPKLYTYFMSRTSDFRNYAIKNMTGSSGRQRVPITAFDSYSVVIAEETIIEKFGDSANEILKKMKQNDIESQILSSLRDTLLPKLISGELRVPESEKYSKRLAK